MAKKHHQVPFRSGFVSLVGRPNVGKSTLTNALVGEKIAITSSKPQTTRHAIRGIATKENGQLILVDTPGIHRPRTLLGQRLNSLVQATLGEVDVIGMCFPANEAIGPGDTFICQELDHYPQAAKVAIITKTDIASKQQIAQQLLAVSELRDWAFIMPVSAQSGTQLHELENELIALLPEGPALYSESDHTDQQLEKRVAELIRECVLETVEDELPHSLAITIDEMMLRESNDIYDIYANIFVERDSQKGIIIGAGGRKLKEIGRQARAVLEPLLGHKVYLSLRVKVSQDWQKDPKKLQRLGF